MTTRVHRDRERENSVHPTVHLVGFRGQILPSSELSECIYIGDLEDNPALP